MKYYERMREIRVDSDDTQQAIAAVLGISQPQYQLYESGKRNIPVDLLAKFCEHYQVSSDYLLGLTPGLSWPRK